MTAKALQKRNNGRLMVHVYLTEEDKKRIEEYASNIGISVYQYIKVKLFSENVFDLKKIKKEIIIVDDFSKDMILCFFNNLKSVLDEIEKGMEKSDYYKALSSFKQNVILSISETTYLNLKKNKLEINKIDKSIIPFLDLIYS